MQTSPTRFCSTVSSTPGLSPEISADVKVRKEAIAITRNLIGSAQKLNELCFVVRRMSASEALAQMKFNKRRKYAEILGDAIKAAMSNAKHNFNLEPSRLLIVRAEVGRATPLKRIKIHAKGKMGMMERPRSNLRVVLREIPFEEGEERLGLRGRKHATLQGNGHANGEKEKIARRRKQYKHIVPQFDKEGRLLGSTVAEYLRKVKSRMYNEREWIRNMRQRFPPTANSLKYPANRSFAEGSRPLQPNGGFAPVNGKGERTRLQKPFSDERVSGMSKDLLAVVRARVGDKKQ